MAHDVFISHSTKDKTISDAICAALEGAAIRCWIAPRDVQPGRSFAGEINRAIQHSKAMVLVFSAHSNNSEQVLREVQLAVNSHLHIVQFRIEDVRLNDDLEYFLSTPHWLDAMEPPLEKHIGRLETAIRALLGTATKESVAIAAFTETQTAATVAQRLEPAPSLSEKPSSRGQMVSLAAKIPRHPMTRGRKSAFAGAIVALLAVGAVGAWWLGIEQPRRETARQRQLIEQKEREGSLKSAATASKEEPYENSLRMKFVPVPGINVLFGVWETRVQDYSAFVEATGRDWPNPSYEYALSGALVYECPAVNVSWEDATAFCEWLTRHERKAGWIGSEQSYRLPSDLEWSAAVGLEKESGSTPEKRNMKVERVYPWGTEWPPPKRAGNYYPSLKVDDFERASPVGSFEANRNGIYDLGGNVSEWCEDWWNEEKKYRLLRGGAWFSGDHGSMLSSFRLHAEPKYRNVVNGFRCVLVTESSR